MPAPYRMIGEPTDDAVLNLRRAERSAWWAHKDARETVVSTPINHPALAIARKRVEATQAAWAAALRELDAITQHGVETV